MPNRESLDIAWITGTAELPVISPETEAAGIADNQDRALPPGKMTRLGQSSSIASLHCFLDRQSTKQLGGLFTLQHSQLMIAAKKMAALDKRWPGVSHNDRNQPV